MKDIPLFTGENGLASLILRAIPASRRAYVIVRAAAPGRMEALLEECGRFCRLAGAETVLATAEESLSLPRAYEVWALACPRSSLPPPEAPVALRPVDARDSETYLRLYNALFQDVPGALPYAAADLPAMLSRERAFFALEGGEMAGLGQVDGSELRAIAVSPAHRGLGARLARTLFAQMPGDEVTLQVSSANAPALRLYEKLGFTKRAVCARWYVLTGR